MVALTFDKQNKAVITNLEQFLATENDLIHRLIIDDEENGIVAILRASSDPIRPVIDDFRFWDHADEEQAFQRARQLLIRLQKTVRLLTVIGYKGKELTILENSRPHNNFIDFNNLLVALPESPISYRDSQNIVNDLLFLIRAKEVQQNIRGNEQTLFDYIDYAHTLGEELDASSTEDIGAYFEDVITALSKGTGWDVDVAADC